MSRHGRTKLVSQKPELKDQALETLEESTQSEQKAESALTELDNEIDCPRCNGIMELLSTFDKLLYWCENCSFQLKCV
jgi:hypothetical protein